jgi:hypothetical protein
VRKVRGFCSQKKNRGFLLLSFFAAAEKALCVDSATRAFRVERNAGMFGTEIATDCDRLVLLIWQAERNSFRSTRICVTCSVELDKRGRTCKFRSHLILVVSAIC